MTPAVLAVPSGATTPTVGETARGAGHRGPSAYDYIDPAKLATGPAARRAWLQGRVLHPAVGKGKAFVVDVPASHAKRLTLLGRNAKGYVVTDVAKTDNGMDHVLSVRATGKQAGQVTIIRSVQAARTDRISCPCSRLAHDGSRLLVGLERRTSSGDYTASYQVVSATTGAVIDTLADSEAIKLGAPVGLVGSSPIEFDGHRTFLRMFEAGPLTWTVGHDPKKFDYTVSTVDIANDLLFLHSGDGLGDDQVGPTSLSDPGEPVWTAPAANAIAVSPGAGLVVTQDPNAHYQGIDDVTVRRMSDGGARSHRRFATGGFAWEDPTHYLVIAYGEKGHALVRCPVGAGACLRVSPLTKGSLSLASPYRFSSTS